MSPTEQAVADGVRMYWKLMHEHRRAEKVAENNVDRRMHGRIATLHETSLWAMLRVRQAARFYARRAAAA